MSQSYRFLHINSSMKMFGDSSNYTIKVEPALRQLKGCRLVALNLPITNYTIDAFNNIIYINDGISTYNAVLTPGVYTITNILTEIKTALEATAYTGTITATFSDLTYRLTIAGTVNFALMFSNTTNSASKLLGFNNVDTPLQLTQTSNNAVNLSVPPCIFIKINELPVMCKSTTGVSGTFPVYLTVVSGEIHFHFAKTHYDLETSGTLGNINNLTVSLINPDDGSLFNLQGTDWSFLLELF